LPQYALPQLSAPRPEDPTSHADSDLLNREINLFAKIYLAQ
jgi:hypothetical protein